MGKKCSVYGCKTGYASQKTDKKISIYRFPRDDEERQRWVRNLPNKLKVEDVTSNMGVCALHFPSDVRLKRVGLHYAPLDPPTIFPKVPSSCCGTSANEPRSTRNSTVGKATEVDEMAEFKIKDTLHVKTVCPTLRSKLSQLCHFSHETDSSLIKFTSLEREGPVPRYSIYFQVIKAKDETTVKELKYEAYFNLRQVRHPTLRESLNCWSQVDEFIRFLIAAPDVIDSKNQEKFQFILRQIQLLNSPKNTRLYSMDDFCQAFSWYATSRSLYEKLRIFLQLPSTSTLRKITCMAKNIDDETLYASYFEKQDGRSKGCIIIVDEIYVKASITYRGGVLFGGAVDKPGKVATTLLCVMVKCLFTGKKFLVKLLPCHALTAAFQFDCIKSAINILEKCGASVLAVISDNNRTNQACYKSFQQLSPLTPWIVRSPSGSEHPLFLLYDPVHLFKNIRNNWITEKTQTLKFYPPQSDEAKEAKWSDLQELNEHESTTLVKLSKLTKNIINPSNIEKQKVSLVINIFCDETTTALKTSSKSCASWTETSEFLDLTIKLWKILNCKSKAQSTRLRDPDRQVIDSSPEGQAALQFLLYWAQLAKQMSPSSSVRQQSLTKDTSEALAWTCQCIAHLSEFLLQTDQCYKHEYVRLGFFQQDDLEKHFGYFRMSAGCNMYLTAEDVYNIHSIDKSQFMLKNQAELELDYKNFHNCKLCTRQFSVHEIELLDDLPASSSSLSPDEKLSIYYIAGYIASKHKNLATAERPADSDQCAAAAAYLNTLNRGGLHYPTKELYILALLAYTFFTKTEEPQCRNRMLMLFSDFKHIFHIDIDMEKAALVRLCNIFMKRFASTFESKNKEQNKRKIAKLSSITNKL